MDDDIHDAPGAPEEDAASTLPVPLEEAELAPLESVRVPCFAVLAALSVLPVLKLGDKKEASRYPTVHVYGQDDMVRVAGTNGARAFIFQWPTSAPPAWLKDGIDLPAKGLADRVKMLDKLGDVLDVTWRAGDATATLSDPRGDALFRVVLESGVKWPAEGLQTIIDGLNFGARQTIDLASTTFAGGYLQAAAAMAQQLGSKAIRLFGSGGAVSDSEPALFDFPGCPGALYLLAPLRGEEYETVAPLTARLLEAPVAGTVAALRAHRTRWEKKLASAASERQKRIIADKIAEYDQRIDQILGRTRTALPAPPKPPEVDAEDAVQDAPERFDEHAADRPVTFVPRHDWTQAAAERQEVLDEDHLRRTQEYRSRLKGAARKTVLLRFHADINAVLTRDHDGLTVHQLADGVPIDEWFEAGLMPPQAALRCLDWRVRPARDSDPAPDPVPLAAKSDDED